MDRPNDESEKLELRAVVTESAMDLLAGHPFILLAVYCVLALHCKRGGRSFPSVGTIAKRLGLGGELKKSSTKWPRAEPGSRAVQSALSELRRLGLITVEVDGRGRHMPTEYALPFHEARPRKARTGALLKAHSTATPKAQGNALLAEAHGDAPLKRRTPEEAKAHHGASKGAVQCAEKRSGLHTNTSSTPSSPIEHLPPFPPNDDVAASPAVAAAALADGLRGGDRSPAPTGRDTDERAAPGARVTMGQAMAMTSTASRAAVERAAEAAAHEVFNRSVDADRERSMRRIDEAIESGETNGVEEVKVKELRRLAEGGSPVSVIDARLRRFKAEAKLRGAKVATSEEVGVPACAR